tara:strand:+ start:607 stop:858 length:252 start_codon:yes stop_codon:yes gene_type:complete
MDNKFVTINLSPEMFAVLTGLTGLAIAVMQNDPEVAQGFATMLSDPEMEPVAKEIVDLLQSITRDVIDGPSGAPITPKIQIVS